MYTYKKYIKFDIKEVWHCLKNQFRIKFIHLIWISLSSFPNNNHTPEGLKQNEIWILDPDCKTMWM